MDSSTFTLRTGPFPIKECTVGFYYYFIEIPVLNAKSVVRSVTFNLSLHCLLMSILWDARHKWV